MAATSYNEFPDPSSRMAAGAAAPGTNLSQSASGSHHQNSSSGLAMALGAADSTSLATQIVNKAQKQRAKKYAKAEGPHHQINILNSRKKSARKRAASGRRGSRRPEGEEGTAGEAEDEEMEEADAHGGASRREQEGEDATSSPKE